ncbi:ExeM/NucH family extracellular endonuclease [Nocardioides mangrovi]|uniref:ExeM/NucH family extracellular endonuclease n=1 Tax=Nocardioides mangrovi TaxID=2874580 RepID=A0ABS7UHQ7_9ACTN|nr:ExeM/NucH family extracellular endonuclease [Nocardioides mangrovi]MBZ5740369.1 ExeM/NucH family extracellular endonuclease [Nocardioides mangrovi]
MSSTSRAPRRGLAAAAGLAVVVTGLALAPAAPAGAVSTGLVISEVYGGGGNSGATYTNDFIELYNPTGAAISVDGMSVQYRSSSGTGAASGVTALSGSVPAGGHYLVQEAAGAAGTTALPTPDATGTVAMSGTAFTVWLAQGTTALTPTADGTAVRTGIVDLVGVNSNTFETAKTAGTANATSASRTGSDTDNNATDFVVGAPSPESAGSTPTDPGDDEPTEATIAEVQGTGDTSPLVGKEVDTEGVVTAAYPTGGYNGFYLQTPGTPDTPGASDAVFVYGSAATAKVAIGDSVEVIGDVSEYNGTTEITPDAADVTVLDTSLGDVTPLSVPWSDLDTAAEKEAHEGELVAPQGDFTVSDNYDTNYYASFTLASGDHPLVQPTDVADAQDTAAIAAVNADNAARAITLDDGASINFNSAANKSIPLPWLSNDNPVRVGSAVTFHEPLVLEYRNSMWNLQPTSQVTDDGADVATFTNTRTPAPEDVGGDIRLATFNVLNYFPTTGADYEASGLGTCSYYTDRAGNKITVNTCGTDASPGPRGAADDASLERQQAKIVSAINKLGASIVSLEEIENSVKFGKDRDYGVSTLVDALNAAAGSDVWAYAPSPDAADLPSVEEQDVIRTAFIYKPAAVSLVGPSKVLTDAPAFNDAREPLAQGFKAAGAPDSDAFAVIVNHFKSKGSGVDDGTGQGNANPDRVAQAEALSDFASSFSSDLGTDKVFLSGDFNSYTQEDPLQVLYGDGYTNLSSTTDPQETTYSFDGLAGSLDHVLASPAAKAMVTGVDIWNINADESIAFEYSRYNYNATDFYEAGPYRASDHDPEVVGLDLPAIKTATTTTVSAVPPLAIAKLTPVGIVVRVTADGATPTGTVTVSWEGKSKEVRLVRGYAATTVGPFTQPGTQKVTVTYAGNDTLAPSSQSVDVRVIKLF